MVLVWVSPQAHSLFFKPSVPYPRSVTVTQSPYECTCSSEDGSLFEDSARDDGGNSTTDELPAGIEDSTTDEETMLLDKAELLEITELDDATLLEETVSDEDDTTGAALL